MHHDPEFHFCPVCGGRLRATKIRENDPERSVCSKCKFVFYLDPKVVACAIVEMGNHILLLRRGVNPQKGKWAMPGGYVDRGETVEAAAVMETSEESGIKTKTQRLLGVYSYEGETPLVIVYVSKYLEGELIPGDEVMELNTFSRSSIPWNDLAFRTSTKALRDYYGLSNRITGAHA
jgi:ADP-ribose pyrophosphatase YjhB (NUDIX family)